MKKSTTVSRIMLGVIAATASIAAKAAPLWEFDTAGTSFTNGSWTFATSFTANADMTVTGLGYYADPTTGSVDANPVALYECANLNCTSTGTLLASVIVDNTYALTGHFRYVTVDPIALLAGHSYQVSGVSLGDNYTWDDPGFATDPNISLIALGGQVGRWQSGATPDFLNYGQSDLGSRDGYWGANVFVGPPTFTGVPEPGTLALFSLSLLGIAFATRRRRVN